MPKNNGKNQRSYPSVWISEQLSSGFAPAASTDSNSYCLCQLCQQPFSEGIYIHYANTHFLLVCNPCNTCFNGNDYRVHTCQVLPSFAQHHNMSYVRCYLCNIGMNSYAQWEDHCKDHMLQCWKCHSSFTSQTEYLNHQVVCAGHALETSGVTHVPRALTLENMLFEKRKRDSNNEADVSVGKKQKWQHNNQRCTSQPLTETLSKGNKLQDRISLSKNEQQKSRDHVKWLSRESRAFSRNTPSVQEDDYTDTPNATPTPRITPVTGLNCNTQTVVGPDRERTAEPLPTENTTLLRNLPYEIGERLNRVSQIKGKVLTQTSILHITPVAKIPEDRSQSEPKAQTSRLMASVHKLQATVGKAPRSIFDTNLFTQTRGGLVIKPNDSPTKLNSEEQPHGEDCPQTEETSFSSGTTLSSSEVITITKMSESMSPVPCSEDQSAHKSNIIDGLTAIEEYRTANKFEIVIQNITDSAFDSETDAHMQEISQDTVTKPTKLISIVSDIPSIATTVPMGLSQHPSTLSPQPDNTPPLSNPVDRKKITTQMILKMKTQIEELESNQKLLEDHDLRKCQERIMKLEAIIASKNVIIHNNQKRLQMLEKEYFNMVVKQATEKAHQILSKEQISQPQSSRDVLITEPSSHSHNTNNVVLEEVALNTLGADASTSLEWFNKLTNDYFPCRVETEQNIVVRGL